MHNFVQMQTSAVGGAREAHEEEEEEEEEEFECLGGVER